MRTTQHTPGYWYAIGADVWTDYTDEDANKHNVHIAEITNQNKGQRHINVEEMANARLISAAPELLAALEAVVEVIDFSRGAGREAGEQTEAQRLLILARAAIAKARGQS